MALDVHAAGTVAAIIFWSAIIWLNVELNLPISSFTPLS